MEGGGWCSVYIWREKFKIKKPTSQKLSPKSNDRKKKKTVFVFFLSILIVFLSPTNEEERAPAMSQGGGMDFNLAEEVLAVIPTDPYEQLDLARKITSMAITSRVSKMEGEMGRMRAKMYEKDHIIFELEDKLSTLQQHYQDAESRFKIAFEQNVSPFHFSLNFF